MLTVHHLEQSRSQRILWLLEELDVPYEVRIYKRNPKTLMAPPELKAIHPLGKSPVITHEGRVIAESGAILEYLLDQFDKQDRFRPLQDAEHRLRYQYWLHYAEGSAMPPLLVALIFATVAKAPLPFFIRPIVKGIVGKVNSSYTRPQLKTHFDFMESELQKNRWFAGDAFSAADIQMSYPVEAGLTRGVSPAQYPKLSAFLKAISERPAYKKAEAKVGSFGMPGKA